MKSVVIYTDGACKGNPGPGGWGAIIMWDRDNLEELSGGSEYTTNNRMEMTAVIKSLEALGNISYEIYLVQGGVISLLFPSVGKYPIVYFISTVLLSIILAYLLRKISKLFLFEAARFF